MTIRRPLALLTMLAGSALFAPLASAQFDISIPPEVIDYAGAAETAIEGNAPAPAAGVLLQPEVFSYAPSEAVSQRVRDNILASIPDDAAAKASLREAMEDRQILDQFAALLKRYGYDIHNVADVMTAYYVMCWEVVHDADASRLASGIAAFHERLVSSLAASPKLAQMSDADKQMTAETLAYMAAIAAGARNQLTRSGNAAALQRIQQQVHDATLKLGVDLKAVRLTDDGFVPA